MLIFSMLLWQFSVKIVKKKLFWIWLYTFYFYFWYLLVFPSTLDSAKMQPHSISKGNIRHHNLCTNIKYCICMSNKSIRLARLTLLYCTYTCQNTWKAICLKTCKAECPVNETAHDFLIYMCTYVYICACTKRISESLNDLARKKCWSLGFINQSK